EAITSPFQTSILMDGLSGSLGAPQYRFVRVIRVLIFPGTRSCVGLVLAAKVLVSHHYRPPSLAAPEGAASAYACQGPYGIRRPGFTLSAGRVRAASRSSPGWAA